MIGEGRDRRIYIAPERGWEYCKCFELGLWHMLIMVDYMGQWPLRQYVFGLGDISHHCWYSGVRSMEPY